MHMNEDVRTGHRSLVYWSEGSRVTVSASGRERGAELSDATRERAEDRIRDSGSRVCERRTDGIRDTGRQSAGGARTAEAGAGGADRGRVVTDGRRTATPLARRSWLES